MQDLLLASDELVNKKVIYLSSFSLQAKVDVDVVQQRTLILKTSLWAKFEFSSAIFLFSLPSGFEDFEFDGSFPLAILCSTF